MEQGHQDIQDIQDIQDLAVVIMAGGAGTRFWPLSIEARPKQFLHLFGDRSLLQLSVDRVADLVSPERLLILTNAAFVDLVRQQLPALPERNVIGEPMRRDTSAAVALAALLCRRRFGNPTMAVLTADHLIEPVDMFQRTLLSAARAARQSQDALYTFGVQPTYPATGFGYLQRGEHVIEDDGIDHFQLVRFVEKPDLPTAREYLECGEYYWNSGMFVWTTDAILRQLRRHLPDHVRHLEQVVIHDGAAGWTDALRRGFEPLTPISIDFGVMEKADKVRCLACRFHWNDVGGWLALEPYLKEDEEGNAHRGRLFCRSSTGNLVFCEQPDEAVALVGVDNLVVVRAGDRTLVVHRDRTEEIKDLVKQLDATLR